MELRWWYSLGQVAGPPSLLLLHFNTKSKQAEATVWLFEPGFLRYPSRARASYLQYAFVLKPRSCAWSLCRFQKYRRQDNVRAAG